MVNNKKQDAVTAEWKRYLESDEYQHDPECGTLLIARHFAEWGKQQAMKDDRNERRNL